MPRHGTFTVVGHIFIYSVVGAFTQKETPVLFNMGDQIAPLHATPTTKRSRRIFPLYAFSDNSRLVSSTSWSASRKFSRASLRVRPCVFTPGISSIQAAIHFPSFLNAAVYMVASITQPTFCLQRRGGGVESKRSAVYFVFVDQLDDALDEGFRVGVKDDAVVRAVAQLDDIF